MSVARLKTIPHHFEKPRCAAPCRRALASLRATATPIKAKAAVLPGTAAFYVCFDRSARLYGSTDETQISPNNRPKRPEGDVLNAPPRFI
jgi:hypothetical protein